VTFQFVRKDFESCTGKKLDARYLNSRFKELKASLQKDRKFRRYWSDYNGYVGRAFNRGSQKYREYMWLGFGHNRYVKTQEGIQFQVGINRDDPFSIDIFADQVGIAARQEVKTNIEKNKLSFLKLVNGLPGFRIGYFGHGKDFQNKCSEMSEEALDQFLEDADRRGIYVYVSRKLSQTATIRKGKQIVPEIVDVWSQLQPLYDLMVLGKAGKTAQETGRDEAKELTAQLRRQPGSPFRIGKVYQRRHIHEVFGGQKQGGISTPRNYPIILLFTGGTGAQYGYKDRWTDGGVFLYTGEGQKGNMQFTKGNAAIRKSITDGKDIYLFEYAGKGNVKYIGQMVYQGYQLVDGLDRYKRTRNMIIFELLPFDQTVESQGAPVSRENLSVPLDELRQKALEDAAETTSTASRVSQVHQRSMAIRAYVLRRAGGKCEGCKKLAPFETAQGMPYLEPHHIRRLSDGGPDRPEWVAALCPNCHAKAHYSKDKQIFNSYLRQVVLNKEKG
jgi:5-methylcytosine-specific restriction protein A